MSIPQEGEEGENKSWAAVLYNRNKLSLLSKSFPQYPKYGDSFSSGNEEVPILHEILTVSSCQSNLINVINTHGLLGYSYLTYRHFNLNRRFVEMKMPSRPKGMNHQVNNFRYLTHTSVPWIITTQGGIEYLIWYDPTQMQIHLMNCITGNPLFHINEFSKLLKHTYSYAKCHH